VEHANIIKKTGQDTAVNINSRSIFLTWFTHEILVRPVLENTASDARGHGKTLPGRYHHRSYTISLAMFCDIPAKYKILKFTLAMLCGIPVPEKQQHNHIQ
jgi:hypothetical protein